MIFVDEAKIFIKAGHGGKGCESFYRDRLTRHPKPDGGDGGKGGDVIIQVSERIHTLLDFRYKQHYSAKRGGHGSSKGKNGRSGADSVLRVPQGTIVHDADEELLIKDLVEPDQSVIVARGGAGGRGNKGGRTVAEPGLGEEKTIRLVLKLIADVGIVGFPNAGKSTLISNISKVKSPIANYPFTTKRPILGFVKDEAEEIDFVVADLPGLIEGAHKGRGLGDRFLKHAERTKILLHLVDMSGEEGRDPFDDYKQINHELESYSKKLSVKHKIVVANKMDCEKSEENLKQFEKKYKDKVFAISALNKTNIDPLLDHIRQCLASN